MSPLIHAADPEATSTCFSTETVNTAALTTVLKHIIANNRAGGWRKLKSRSAQLTP